MVDGDLSVSINVNASVLRRRVAPLRKLDRATVRIRVKTMKCEAYCSYLVNESMGHDTLQPLCEYVRE